MVQERSVSTSVIIQEHILKEQFMKRNLKVLIITCWVVLGICCILKLIGLDIFTVGTDNENLTTVLTFIDKHFVLKVICTCVVSLILNTLTLLAILQQKFYTKCQMFVFLPLIIGASIAGWYFSTLSLILNIVLCISVIPFLKRKWYRCPLGMLLVLIFQMISILTKNVGDWTLYDSYFLPSILLQIDSFIMVTLFYLYSIRKEVS